MSQDCIDALVETEDLRVGIVKSVLSEGIDSARDLKKKTGLTIMELREICEYAKVHLPEKVLLYGRKQGLGELIAKGLTLQGIGDHFGFSRERARQVLHQCGLYNLWVEERKKCKEQHDCTSKIHELSELFGSYLSLKLASATWAEGKVVKYFQEHPRTRYDLNKLERLFDAYYSAQSKNQKRSLDELGKAAGFTTTQVSMIFGAVCIKPMHRKLDRHYVSPVRKNLIKKCFELRVPSADVAYLLGEKHHVVGEVFRKMGKRQKQKRYYLPGRATIKYSDASIIYLGQDMGLSIDEIARDLNKKPITIRHVIEKRELIAPRIIDVLRTKYPMIETPYS